MNAENPNHPPKPREFWIDPVSIGRSIANKCNLFSCADMPSDRAWIHVVEAFALEQATAEIAELRAKYDELVSYLPKIPTQPFEKELVKENRRLRAALARGITKTKRGNK